MGKDFQEWHRIKEDLDKRPSISFYYQEREVWWCWIGLNIGHEQNGGGKEFKRPVIISYSKDSIQKLFGPFP